MTEINENSALKNDDWRSVIDGTERSWYLRHQNDYGSWRWIKWKLFVCSIFAVISFVVAEFPSSFPRYQSKLLTLQWICSYLAWTFIYTLPLLILYYILCHIPILDDAIGLKKEVKSIAVIFSIIVVLSLIISVIYPSIVLIHEKTMILYTLSMSSYSQWIPPIWILVRRILFIPINYMQTRWVVNKYSDVQRKRTGELSSDPTAISLSTSKMRGKANETTWKLIDVANASLTPDSEEMRSEMKVILTNYRAFEAFMRFLLEVWYNGICSLKLHSEILKRFQPNCEEQSTLSESSSLFYCFHFPQEFCHDFLLGIIEMVQFKVKMFREVISPNPDLMRAFEQSESTQIAKCFIEIPAECPGSVIVFGDENNNYKSMAKRLYEKYIKDDAPYDTFVDLTTRQHLETLIERDDWESDEEKEDLMEL